MPSLSHSAVPLGPNNLNMLRGPAKFIGAVKDEWQLYSDCASDYTIGSPIGFGASSIVYAATYHPQPLTTSTPPPPPIKCALKVLDLDALPPRALALLQQETTLMSLSKHPNVLRVRGSWMDGHKLYIALRLMNKGSAADVMRYGWPGGMEEDVVRCILRQALKGLNYLHTNGFIHRDIKAANLLIDDDGTVLLGDLGVAANLAEDTSQLLGASKTALLSEPVSFSPQTHNGHRNISETAAPTRVILFDHTVPIVQRPRMGKRKSFVGTPCWMAPELIQGQQYDSSADIWSFGITALELTQGRPPRSRETQQQVLLRIIQDDPPTLHRVGGAYKYSRAFKELVDSCLIKDPSKRPTAQELLETPFFKASKKKYYLVGAILKDLPPLSERQERRAAHHPQALHIVDSWDFATTLSPGVAYEQRAEAGSSSIADYSQASDGVFEIEDDPVRQEERHKARIPKGISWAQESDLAPVQDELEPPETDIQSPSDLSDSDAADPQASRSPSTSATDDDSSPPSSFPDPTSIPNPRILLAQPIDVLPMNKPPHERELSAAGPSLRVFPPTSTSSPNLRPLSSSASQVGLWQKFKSNVRRPSTRDGPSSVS